MIDPDREFLLGCPVETWDGPYLYRCGLGGDGLECAYHGRFELARRCTASENCRRPEGHGGTCVPQPRSVSAR